LSKTSDSGARRTHHARLLEEGGTLIDDLMGVDGGLDDVLGRVLLGTLYDGHHTLTVDDGLHLIDYVGVNFLLDNRWSLNHPSLSRGHLSVVLLNVMDNVLVNLSVDNRLDLNDTVTTDGLLYNGSRNMGSLLNGRLLDSGGVDGRGR